MSQRFPIFFSAVAAALSLTEAAIAAPIRHRPAVSCTEGFDDVSRLTANGWIIRNNSDPIGSTDWFQGIASRFAAHDGASTSYVSADSNNASGSFPVLSDWLITPDIGFESGSSVVFWTRELAGAADAPNHLDVRVCVDGGATACTFPGAESGSLGGFETLLIDINLDAVAGGYPATWTQFNVGSSLGLPQSGRGRIAFHYYDLAQSTGIIGTTIGIDSVSFNQIALCPASDVVFTGVFEAP